MKFTKEHPRPGPGRPQGSKDKKGARAVAAQVREAVMRTGLTPLQFLAEIYQDESRPIMERLDAAKAAAPYLHQRMPQKIDLSAEVAVIPAFLPKRRVPDDELGLETPGIVQAGRRLISGGGRPAGP
jgi:hypothetical protein